MGRPREFDEQEVLQSAMLAFWTHGYQATSMADLMKATGLAKGSVYKGFGDKKSLFLRALDHYLEQGREVFVGMRDAHESPRDFLRAWLSHVAALATEGTPRKGCFGVNSVAELGPHDAEVRSRIRAHEAWMHRELAIAIEQAVESGELRADLRPTEAARWVTTVMGGLQVRGKLGITRREANRMSEFALLALTG